MDKTEKLLDGIEQLPPAPQILPQLLQALSEEDTDLGRLVEIVSLDPALTAEMLKICNSAFFRGSDPVNSVAEAVRRLGLQVVFRIVASVSGARTFTSSRHAAAMNAALLWRHSVTTAFAAQFVAGVIDAEPGMLFTAGLLHDIGKLALGLAYQAEYTRLLKDLDLAGPALVAQEKDLFGLDHAEVGSRLLNRWGFSAPIVSIVGSHHHPTTASAGTNQNLAACINLADALAHTLEPAHTIQTMAAFEPAASIEILKRSPEDLSRSRDHVMQNMELVETMCRLNL